MGFLSHSSLVLISLMNDTHIAEALSEVSTPSMWTTWHHFTDTLDYSLSLKITSFLLPPPSPRTAAHQCLCWLVLIFFLTHICFLSILTLR